MAEVWFGREKVCVGREKRECEGTLTCAGKVGGEMGRQFDLSRSGLSVKRAVQVPGGFN